MGGETARLPPLISPNALPCQCPRHNIVFTFGYLSDLLLEIISDGVASHGGNPADDVNPSKRTATD